MRELSVREIRAALPRLEALLREQGEVVVTRRGKPIARLSPAIPEEECIPPRAELRSRMKRLEVGSEALIREDRDARG